MIIVYIIVNSTELVSRLQLVLYLAFILNHRQSIYILPLIHLSINPTSTEQPVGSVSVTISSILIPIRYISIIAYYYEQDGFTSLFK
jgi:hypothetical protein